ncbi:MAG TPA: asparagine synthase (glutamine-hydrolyzing) [Candidatus Tectomicrobia bacterium]|nr:asparagine synthase (glutamine-hydrolyzing) [Candidatus Tectomicrobia bacterium]
MCGIAGRFNFQTGEPVAPATIARMCDSLVHRGPDEDGLHLDGAFGMGMRRLRIIDLVTGRQPLANEDGTVWTVFNGEIYNHRELRRTLAARGHTFRTASDTEVIVHLYEDHGECFVEHLAGMFAIAVWDAPRRRLVLARDRLGIKPLYYAVDGRRLRFASEVKALLADGVARDVDPQAVHDYLSLGYVAGPRSIFRAVRRLPPGHLLVASEAGVGTRRYWTLGCGPGNVAARRTEASYAEELEGLLKVVVAQHLLSDVPLGIFLSGGVDSSSLVALTREVSAAPVRTFSIGFPERTYDELDRAGTVARALETEHHALVVDPATATLLPDLIRSFDEPFADSSAVPVYCVSRLARQHVTVALSGEGGDEVFAGYETYVAGKLARLYQRLPAIVGRRLVPGVVRRLPTSHRRVSFDYRAKRFVAGALLPPADAHYAWKVLFTEDVKAALYARPTPALADPVRLYREAHDACPAPDALARLQHVDLAVYLPDDLLVKVDRMSMAHSLEARVPYVDHRLVEFTATLPSHLKLRGLRKKYLLKRVMSGRLPRPVLHGPKRGFNVPMPAWLAGPLREFVHATLAPGRLRRHGVFDARAVADIVRMHERREADMSRQIWALLVFTAWCDAYGADPAAAGVAAGECMPATAVS